jgi:NitT/TauT family transport system substrate-binding protein
LVVVVAVLFLIAGCASSASAKGSSAGVAVGLRLGYFPNITHGVALVGLASGIMARDLTPDRLDASQTFNAGPAETQALLGGAIDVAFIGPSPTISAFTQSHGAVTVISGAASGGAALVVKMSITAPAQLKGKTIATPQLGNTQDVALRAYLKGQGLTADAQGGGEVSVKPESNSQTVTAFQSGAIDGAWVPEPYVALLVASGGHVLVNETSQWPNGKFVTTDVLVRTAFLRAHPATITRLLTGIVETIDYIDSKPAEAQAAANRQLATLGAPLTPSVLAAAWSDLSFTVDPLVGTFQKEAANAVAAGLSNNVSLTGLFALAPLNAVLSARHLAPVATS